MRRWHVLLLAVALSFCASPLHAQTRLKVVTSFSILGDFAAALPTPRKAWLKPETENRSTYLISFAGMILGILSIKEPTFAAYAFNAYLVAASTALVLVCYWPRKRGVTATHPVN